MPDAVLFNRFAPLAHTLLDPNADEAEVQHALGALHALLGPALGIGVDGQMPAAFTEHLVLPSGEAGSPVDALRSGFDVAYTQSFLLGTQAALRDLQTRFPRQTLHVVYAGCGPLASAVLPLTTVFAPHEVQFTLVEAHPASHAAVTAVVDALGIGDWVRAIEHTDAAAYRHPDGLPLHLMVTETVQAALKDEPAVAIFHNLVPQLIEGGLTVPASVVITATLVDPAQAFGAPMRGSTAAERPARIDIGPVCTLTAEAACAASVHYDGRGHPFLADTAVDVPPHDERAYLLMYHTAITPHGEHVLADNASGATRLLAVQNAPPFRSGDTLAFRYYLGSSPILTCRSLSADPLAALPAYLT